MDPPLRPPIPSMTTSSCSSMKSKAPSYGMKAVHVLPFLMSWILTHFLTPELGFLGSRPTFSRTIPLACGVPSDGVISPIRSILFLNLELRHLKCFRSPTILLAANSPVGDLTIFAHQLGFLAFVKVMDKGNGI